MLQSLGYKRAEMSDLKYWVGFNRIQGIGRARFSQLEGYFGDLERAWKASPAELRTAGLDTKSVESIIVSRPDISPDAELEKLERHHIRALTWNDPDFPARLKEIYDVPPLLYVKGNITQEDEWTIAVVGTRRATIYGREVTERLVNDLVRNRITVVSGLARGIDSIAHRTALEAGGRTIAVFACGLDEVYPPENVKLAQAIMEHGALVSEHPLGTRPKKEHFPLRNRIMSGLSLGVLVIEGDVNSGAMITANRALEQNREVFAVPGNVLSPASRGTNRLIKEGAKLVSDVQDILEELNLTMIPQQLEMRDVVPENETESVILKHLSFEPTHIDTVCRTSCLPIATVSSTLAMMELKGLVRQMGGMNYIIAREARTDYQLGAN
jgi:DNA processing protein